LVQLISSEDYKVWFLDIQDPSDEVNRQWVRLALRQIVPMGINSIFAYPDTGDHVCVRDLDNLEFAILPDSQFPDRTTGDRLFAGDRKLAIKGYGEVDICLQNAIGNKLLLRLDNVAFVPEIATTLVSLRPLRARGIWWDTRPQTTVLRRADGIALGILEERFNQFVLEYVPNNHDRAAFFARRSHFNSWTRRGPRKAEAWLWHLRLGHTGPKALEHLVNSSEGVRIKGPTTTQCDSCAQAKMKRQIQRAARRLDDFKPGEKIALDFHDFEEDPEHYSSLMLLTDRVSGYMWDYYLQDRTTESIIAALASFLGMMERQFGIKIKAFEADNEIITVKPPVKEWIEERHIRLEPSPPHTQALNGAGERSGGVVKEKINAMRDSSIQEVAL
jgi:hypothetical protein